MRVAIAVAESAGLVSGWRSPVSLSAGAASPAAAATRSPTASLSLAVGHSDQRR